MTLVHVCLPGCPWATFISFDDPCVVTTVIRWMPENGDLAVEA